MINKIYYCLLTIFLIFASARNFSAQGFLAPRMRLSFGNHLFLEKDYIRALDEYRSWMKTSDNDTVRFKIAWCLSEMDRHTEAADNYKGLFFNSTLENESRLEYYRNLFLTGDYNFFRKLSVQEAYLPEEGKNVIAKLERFSWFLERKGLPDSSYMFEAFSEAEKDQVKDFYMKYRYPEKKSPAKAAIMSALVPGLGKIYTGKYSDGITAFIVTGVLTYLAIDNFQQDHDIRKWLFTGLAAWFYGGNIYGSAASAQIYNAGLRINLLADIEFFLGKNNWFIPQHQFLR